MSYFGLVLIKILDNLVNGFKSISQVKGLKVISSLLVALSQLMFYVIIKRVVSDSSMTCILLISIASGVGNYLAFVLCDYFKKESRWINYITSSNKEDLESLCDYLCDHRIKYLVNEGYNRKWERTYNITVFSYTKEQSKLLDKFLKNNMDRYLREILK